MLRAAPETGAVIVASSRTGFRRLVLHPRVGPEPRTYTPLPPPRRCPFRRAPSRDSACTCGASCYEGWRREDGLFDIEGQLVDTKDHDYTLASGVRPAGTPIHEMSARVTIDAQYVIHALVASSDGVPYPDGCERIAPKYAELVGTNLMHGFRKHLHDRMGGVGGCTHVTELLATCRRRRCRHSRA